MDYKKRDNYNKQASVYAIGQAETKHSWSRRVCRWNFPSRDNSTKAWWTQI